MRPVSRSAIVLVYLGLTLLQTWPLLLAPGTTLPNDLGGPGLVTFALWWNAHVLPFTTRWWNAPFLFPLSGTFALVEACLGLAVIATPLQWMGATPVLAHNLTYVLSFPLAGLAAHALAYRLTGRHDAAFIAGVAYGFNPYRAAELSHLTMLMSCWMPLGLLALDRFSAKRRLQDLVWFAVLWILNGLTNGSYLVFFTVLVCLWSLWFVRTVRMGALLAVALGLASAVFVPLLIGANHVQHAVGLSRDPADVGGFGADLTAFWAASPAVWLPHHWTVAPRPEGELYPGATILLVTGIAGVVAWRHLARRPPVAFRLPLLGVGLGLAAAAAAGWRRPMVLTGALWCFAIAALADRRLVDLWRRRSVFAFYALATLALVALALGPVGRVFDVRIMDPAPYAWLMALPVVSTLRVPARFGMLVALTLAEAAGLGFARLTPHGPRRGVGALVVVLVALEGWIPHLRTVPAPATLTLNGVDPHAVVLEVPMVNVASDTEAIFRVTSHGHPVVNGAIGEDPPYYVPLREGLRADDSSVFDALQSLAPLVVVVNRVRDPGGAEEAFVRARPDASEFSRWPLGPVFALPARPRVPAASGVPLAIASVEASTSGDDASLLLDGRLDTAWSTIRPQTAGDEIRVTLARPSTVSRIELDLGDATGSTAEFPRGLRVTVTSLHGPSTVVWEGGTAGLAMLGALADRARVPIVIDVPAVPLAATIALTLTEDDFTDDWMVAELHVFGTDGASGARRVAVRPGDVR